MKIETFECSETAAEPTEASEEAIAIMEALGLDGQKSLVTKHEASGSDTRCPYREMTRDEAFAYKVLCPKESTVKSYAASPIPLRVLQVAANAKELGFFKEIMVWDRESAAVSDPVLVGQFVKDTRYDWMRTPYILARWGETLETFSVLLKRALDIQREKYKSALRAIRAKVNQMGDGDAVSDEHLISGRMPDFNE